MLCGVQRACSSAAVSTGGGSSEQRASPCSPQHKGRRNYVWRVCATPNASTSYLHSGALKHALDCRQSYHPAHVSPFPLQMGSPSSLCLATSSRVVVAAALIDPSDGMSPSQSDAASSPDEQTWTLKDFLQKEDAELQQSGSQHVSQQQKQWAHRQQWQRQQAAKQHVKREQQRWRPQVPKQPGQLQQQQQDASKSGHTPYPYDMTRWQVRNRDWRTGPPPKLDYLVVSPHNLVQKHARYMVRRLLNSNKGCIMLLFHSHQGTSKALQILRTASHILQRKHQCSLLCQVGFTVHDPMRMRLLVQLWPYAGVLHSQAINGYNVSLHAKGDQSSGGLHADDSGSRVQHSINSSDPQQGASSSNSRGSSNSSSKPKGPKGGSWMRLCLEGSIPVPSTLPRVVAHLPPVAVPLVVSHKVTLNASRHSQPPKLARQIASALQLKGRCRVNAAGGIAGLNAFMAVALAELLLMRSSGQGLAMHVQTVAKPVPLPAGSPVDVHSVRYYQLTLLLCKRTGRDGEFIPATCVFPVKQANQQQQQQQQSRQGVKAARDENDEGEGYLWYPHGLDGPTHLLLADPNTTDQSLCSINTAVFAQLSAATKQQQCASSRNAKAQPVELDAQQQAAATFYSHSTSSIQLGQVLDKYLCFYGSCRLAVVGGSWEAGLALAAVTTAIRETHRCSSSTILMQLQPLLPCAAIPSPPEGSFMVQLQRVARPLPLPKQAQLPLLADWNADSTQLADAITRQLLHGKGCASVLVRQGSGISVATSAIMQARSILLALYNRDCCVYIIWKTSNQAAAADACATPQQQQQEQLSQHANALASVQTNPSQQQQQYCEESAHVNGAEQQQVAPVQTTVPQRVYKLLLMSCDVGNDMTQGWVKLGAKPRQQQRAKHGTQRQQSAGEAHSRPGSMCDSSSSSSSSG